MLNANIDHKIYLMLLLWLALAYSSELSNPKNINSRQSTLRLAASSGIGWLKEPKQSSDTKLKRRMHFQSPKPGTNCQTWENAERILKQKRESHVHNLIKKCRPCFHNKPNPFVTKSILCSCSKCLLHIKVLSIFASNWYFTKMALLKWDSIVLLFFTSVRLLCKGTPQINICINQDEITFGEWSMLNNGGSCTCCHRGP